MRTSVSSDLLECKRSNFEQILHSSGTCCYLLFCVLQQKNEKYVIVKARQRGNYAANSPSPRALGPRTRIVAA